ncbi:hypothetical protein COU17_01785 [Candidatus Kaiserbacteria bacterium CG10_big_fil_rev_8_21_14_0_10_49_17]|uniref:Metallo-beta-lactamase domain-containing protein n=1 Tax=Candidatus Kaiserbacteria bacterium CG10_big_fil_rev_8_21_14_0_10_49_17 TaxID=1974609 RepID=A0A2M6WEJ4_9BACT|nr:MAG: hypothetical protein COU17_01785 [Candidatus Kaiserbacteria bacterium CG10_big_fil_rev_8_21_14_0_10_49_17]
MRFSKTKVLLSLLCVLLLINAVIFYGLTLKESSALTISFLDVGQGDAIFIEAPTGNQMLIDGGRGKGVLSELSRVVPFFDRSIDVILATHPDADHIAGLIDVFPRYDISLFLESGVEHETGVTDSLERIVNAEAGLTRVLARAGMRVHLGGGARLDILFPDRDVSGIESNAGSVVARLSYGETSVMLTGDSPVAIEAYLASHFGGALHSTILKLGHHGSKTSSSLPFLSAVSPDVGIISAGKDNTYGHPHQEVLERVAELGIPLVSTIDLGMIQFVSDGKTFRRR